MDEASQGLIAVTLFALAVGLVFIAGCAIQYGRHITSPRIPMQWGSGGKPLLFAPRLMGLWFGFGFTAVLSALLLVITLYEPQKLATLVVATMLVVGTNMWAQPYHLKRVIRWETDASGR